MKTPIVVAVVAIVIAALGFAYVTGILGDFLKKDDTLGFTVDFTATPVSGQNGTFNFTATISGGIAPYQFFWSFGDDTFSRSAQPQHTYAAAGTYTVELLVVDNASVSRTASKAVVVA